MQLVNLPPQARQCPGTFGREHVFASCLRRDTGHRTSSGSEPSLVFHAREERVERAGTHLESVSAKFLEQPLSIDRTFPGVVKNVDLPERQMYFTRNLIGHLYPAASHTRSIIAPGR
jgi:hypothetical protein